MFILNCLLFYIIWAKLVYSPIPSLIFIMPFSYNFKELIRFKKWQKPFVLTTIFTYIIYFSAIVNNVSNPSYIIAFFIIFYNILLIVNYLILMLIGFIDFYLRSKQLDELLYTFVFYFLYFGYLTICLISSEPLVKITCKLLKI